MNALTQLSFDVTTTPLDPIFTVLPFEAYTLEVAKRVIDSRFTQDAVRSLAFYNGDHWQLGLGWIGPQFPNSSKFYEPTMELIQRTFISRNVIGELVDRHVSGVLARELHWSLTVKRAIPPVEEKLPTGETVTKDGEPTQEEKSLIDEAQMALTDWWNGRNVLETLKRALAGLLCSKRAPLRFSVPPSLRDLNGNLPRTDLAGALDYLYLDHLGYDDDLLQQVLPTATVYINKNNRKPVGIFVYKEIEEERAEQTFIDANGNTVLRIISKEEELFSTSLPLGGRILMYEMTRKALINPQLMSQQKSLNKTITMKDRNDTQGGFLERYLLNAKWPTRTVKKADGTTEEVAEDLYTGAGTVNALQGSSFVDEQGVTHIMNPSVQFRDPVSALTFIQSADHTYLGMLSEGNQLHHATTDADISGESRKQSRESYIKDLQSSANVIESATRWVIETALAQASVFMGSPARYEGLRAYVQAHIDPGPVAPDDLRVAADMLDRGIWDWETAVSATGVDDVDTIKQRIQLDRAENQARLLAFQDATQPNDGTNNNGNGDNSGNNSEDNSGKPGDNSNGGAVG